MSENPGFIPEGESTRLLEIYKIAEATTEKHINVVYAPPIKGNLPSQEVLHLFSSHGSNVWAAVVNDNYTETDLQRYIEEFERQTRDKIAMDGSTDGLYLVGFSASCNIVAQVAKKMGLPKGQVLLGAPMYSPKENVRDRAPAIGRALRNRTPLSEAFGVDADYRRRLTELKSNKASIGGYNSLRRFATIPTADFSYGIVISGGRDAISPRNEHTDIFVPEAGHQFTQFAPKIVDYIAANAAS